MTEVLQPGTIFIYGALSGKPGFAPLFPLLQGINVTGFNMGHVLKTSPESAEKMMQSAVSALSSSLASTVHKIVPLAQIVDAILESQVNATKGKTLVDLE